MTPMMPTVLNQHAHPALDLHLDPDLDVGDEDHTNYCRWRWYGRDTNHLNDGRSRYTIHLNYDRDTNHPIHKTLHGHRRRRHRRRTHVQIETPAQRRTLTMGEMRMASWMFSSMFMIGRLAVSCS